jgi:hypothetical protein
VIYGIVLQRLGTVRELASRNVSRLQAEGMLRIEGRTRPSRTQGAGSRTIVSSVT